MRNRIFAFFLFLPLSLLAQEKSTTRFLPMEADGTLSETGKIFEWENAECVLGKDGKQLSIVVAGKTFQDGKFEIKIIDYDAANVQADEAFFTDQYNVKWEADPLRDPYSRCELRVENKIFEKGKLAQAQIFVRCLRMFSVEGKRSGLKGYITPKSHPIFCNLTHAEFETNCR